MDEKLISVLTDITWRFRIYQQYQRNPEKAIKAFNRRAPGYSYEYYKELFFQDLKILELTIDAVEKAPKRPKPGQKFTMHEDVDTEFVESKLKENFPGLNIDFLTRHISLTVYWYYLK